ncbi:hypothetical protein EDB83DRAFT_2401639, partial [Lactarius deliciosus]
MRSQCESHGHAIRATTIDTLTDNVLLDTFDLIRRSADGDPFYLVWNWHTLVHVCRRWREIIFASPLRLDLQLICTHRAPVRKDLGCWPQTLPIAIDYGYYSFESLTPDDEDSMFAALEQRERVRHVRLAVMDAVFEKVVTFMRVPFPELRYLEISWEGPNTPVLPNDFLGGSAPSLREIQFNGIPFLALPTLLSSAGNLVELMLHERPRQTGYISSAAFTACLAVLPSLEYLSIGFYTPASDTDRVHSPPETRVILPSLTRFCFDGHSTYLEVIMARIDTPQLKSINIIYSFTERLDFQVAEFSKFIERSVIKPSRFGHGEISFIDDDIWFNFFREIDPDEPTIAIQIPSCERRHDQVFDMAHVLNRTSTMLSDVLELFRPFTAVKKLRIYEELVESIGRALEGQTVEARAQVLPALRS